MPQYRLFLFDKRNHIIRGCERECPETEIKLVALDVLQSEGSNAFGVEVWQGTQRLDRIIGG